MIASSLAFMACSNADNDNVGVASLSASATLADADKLAVIQKSGYIGYQINEQLAHLNWVVSRLTKSEIVYADYQV